MSVSWDKRFEIDFGELCPQGALLLGQIEPVNEFQSREDRAKRRQLRQQVDSVTGLRMWKGTFSDPAAVRDGDKSFQVIFTAEVQPVPPEGVEVTPGIVVHPVELEGVTVQPRIEGTGEFKRLGYVVRATGMRVPSTGISAPRQTGPVGKPAEPKPPEGKSPGVGDGKAVA